MAVNKKLLQGAAAAAGELVPSEHFGVVLYEGDGSTSHSINGGKFGAAANFNGSSHISFSNRVFNVPLNGTLSEFSISLWFNAASVPSSGNVEFLSWWQTGSQTYLDGFLGLTTISSNSIRFGDDWQNAYTFSSTSEMVDKWYHLVAVKTSTNAYIYLDGQLESTKGSALSWGFNNSLMIGRQHSAGEYFDGKLDQIRLFQKALSSSEVSTLYAETASTVESLDPLSEDTTDTLQVLGDSSCVAAYQFENDETDLSGNYNGTGTEIQYAAGRYGQAASFNGSSSDISLSTGFSVDTSFTVSFWMKSNQSASSYIFQFLGDTGETYMNSLGLFEAGTKFGLWPYNTTGGQGLSSISTSDTSALFDNNWHHVAVVTDGTSNTSTKIYIDGSEKTITTGESYTTTWRMTGNVSLGDRSDGLYHYDGLLDQLRIFNKALSASEVTTLYNENSLVASYRFEGNANDDTRNYDGTASNVTYEYGLGFQPDFVWVKSRNITYAGNITDSTRGTTKQLYTTSTNAEQTNSTFVTSFDTGGFTVGNNAYVNINAYNFVAWCLKANGGTTSTNTDGTNITSTVQVNTDAGFSIVQFTTPSTFSGSNTVGHGLGVKPDMILVKATSTTEDWYVYHTSMGLNKYMRLNTTAAEATATYLWGTVNDTVFNPAYTSTSPITNIAYCFHSVDGFSKFGSYTGTGGDLIVETGFEPAFLMIKRTDAATYDWYILDNKRNPVDYRNTILRANATDADATVTNGDIDVKFLSNGFAFDDIPTSSGGFNASGGTYIYMAFAADPDTEAPTVAKSFSTVAYTGNSSTQSIEGLGFSPNLVWIKGRNNTYVHGLYDTIRGPLYRLRSNATNANELVSAGTTGADSLTSFDSDGFTLGSDIGQNQSANNYVAWAWKADDNEPTINTEGSIDSVVSANANAGFSIVKYTGNGSSGATIGHGLSAAPEMIFIKNLDGTYSWLVYNSTLGATKYLHLNFTDAQQTASNFFNDTNPSSTVFTLGNHVAVNNSGQQHIAYCFHSVSGYSKFGSYSGNNTGQTITTGFQPDFLMLKKTNITSEWWIMDSVRGTTNNLEANTSDAENTGISGAPTFVSTGFNFSGSTFNETGTDWIYMAFKIN